MLAPQDAKNWHSPKIYNNTAKMSKDHFPIGLTINMTLKRRGAKKIEGIKIKRMKIKDITEEMKENIVKETIEELNKTKWKKRISAKIEDTNLGKIYEKYEKLIWKIAEKTISVTENKTNNYMKTPKKNPQLEQTEKQHGYIVKALLAIPLSKKMQKLSKSIMKINKLDQEYEYIYELDENYMNMDKTLEKLKKHLQKQLKIV
jgi:hypothetical protein